MYDDDRLKTLRYNFLANNRPTELRRLTREKKLDEHLQEMADACRREAAGLQVSGITFEGQAWQWAIRSVLLETEWD